MPNGSDRANLRSRRMRHAPNFMTYPYPDDERVMAHLEREPGILPETKQCIINLLHYRAVQTKARLPKGPSSAVLVPLFVGRSGELYVLLSRRSEKLNSFAGDTALPGGKVDEGDVTVEDTARREAFEEIGLPRDKQRVPLLCVMEPHLAKGEILVTPVVVLILDHSLQPNLNASEVTSIFAQPLVSFLSSTPRLTGSRSADPNIPYYTFTDFPWSKGGTIRLHRFLTGREDEGIKPVFGLTASILVKTATIGYRRTPDFQVQPSNAPTATQQIAYALLTPANPLRIACEQEGIDANKAAARMLYPPRWANAPRTHAWRKIWLEWKNLLEGGGDANEDGGAAAGVDASDSSPGARHSYGQHTGTKEERSCSEARKGMRELSDTKEAHGRQAGEHQEERMGEDAQERLRAIPDRARAEALLNRVKERMEEVRSDERKLAKAKKKYPKIKERVQKETEGARGENDAFDPKAAINSMPRENPEDIRDGVEASKEVTERSKGDMHDGGAGEWGIEDGMESTRKDLEEMKKHVDKGGNEHYAEQGLILKKRNAKL